VPVEAAQARELETAIARKKKAYGPDRSIPNLEARALVK
jgi:hypothetical protein